MTLIQIVLESQEDVTVHSKHHPKKTHLEIRDIEVYVHLEATLAFSAGMGVGGKLTCLPPSSISMSADKNYFELSSVIYNSQN